MAEIARPVEITEDDWMRPLVMVRAFAEDNRAKLTHAQEQMIARGAVEGTTQAILDTVIRLGQQNAEHAMRLAGAQIAAGHA